MVAKADKNGSADGTGVSAIAVVDLARQLWQRQLLTPGQIGDLCGKAVFAAAQQLQQGGDVSGLLSRRLPRSLLLTLWQQAALTAEPLTGWQMGAQIHQNARGILAHWLCHCANLHQAVDVFCRHVALMNRDELWRVTTDNDGLPHILFSYPVAAGYPQLAEDRSLAGFKSWAEYLSGEPLKLQRVCLQRRRCATTAAYIQHYFDCPVDYQADHNRIIPEPGELQKPLLQANAYLAGLLQQQAGQQLAALSEDIVQRLALLFSRSAKQFSHADCVAAELGISRTTLYRQLKQQNTSFSAQLEQWRYHRYQQLLEQGYDDPLTVCELLGYADVSSFYKVRRRWLQNY
ncbi:AraC family transcriptional regulator ligand-binding domain-containing protein [Bacterioplanoides pacificum]|uniref:AraC family transcriptional regulator ligand-binding domain-containing protein n=1 Tax=Bacterioplanoides pacificum TaxID=1171596 RepID=A0ABV7VWC2_9GAMM